MKEVSEVVTLGVRIDKISRKDVLMQICNNVAQNRFLQIATVNAAFILLARKNDKFKKTLNNCDLVIADGSGITIAAKYLHGVDLERYAGADLVDDVLKLAQKNGWRIGFLCAQNGLSKWADVSMAIAAKYSKLKYCGTDIDLSANLDKSQQSQFAQNYVNLAQSAKIQKFLRKNKPDIVLANFGAPTQEYILASLTSMSKDASVVAIGVGGALDFLTGKVARAPKWLRKIGCEWMWRTLAQPNRLRKMCASVIVFPIIALYDRLHQFAQKR